MLCVFILYISGGTYSLKSTPNDKFFFEWVYMEMIILKATGQEVRKLLLRI